MSPADRFLEIARDAATQAQYRASQHEERIAELMAELAEEKLALETANHAHERLADYPVTLGRDYLCPICWIEGKQFVLRNVTGTYGVDRFACEASHGIDVPAGI